jgi:hypothetical protein
VGAFFAVNASAGGPFPISSVEFDPPDFGTAVIDDLGNTTITGSTSFDPNADPILKIFTVRPGAGGFSFQLDELITNNGPTPWTDWHEELLVSDGAGGWTPSTPDDGLFFDSVSLNSPGGTVQGGFGDDMAWMFFDNPVLAGQSIDITKVIVVPRIGITQFAIAEYPTIPVPAAVWLFGSGLIGLIGIARRRKTA